MANVRDSARKGLLQQTLRGLLLIRDYTLLELKLLLMAVCNNIGLTAEARGVDLEIVPDMSEIS